MNSFHEKHDTSIYQHLSDGFNPFEKLKQNGEFSPNRADDSSISLDESKLLHLAVDFRGWKAIKQKWFMAFIFQPPFFGFSGAMLLVGRV